MELAPTDQPALRGPAGALVGSAVDVFLSLLLGALLVRDAALLPDDRAGWLVFVAILVPGAFQRTVLALESDDHRPTTALAVKVASLVAVIVVVVVARQLEVPPSLASGALATRLISFARFRTSDDDAHQAIALALTGVVAGLVFVGGVSGDVSSTVLSGAEPSLGQAVQDLVSLAAVVALFELVGRQAQHQAHAEQATQRALAAERARIARELHDVVAHQMTGVVLQAQGAAGVLRTDPDRAERALETIERSARSGLDELRRLLGVLREGELATGVVPMDESRGDAVASFDDLPAVIRDFYRSAWAGAAGEPEPASVDEALEQARAASAPGQPRIELSVGDGAHTAPPGVQASAVRIVQESLTNVARHVGRAAVEIRLVRVGDDLVVQVENGPALEPPATRVEGSGLGITGMRERAESLGGSLQAGPSDRGGWEVRATLPLTAPDRSPAGLDGSRS